ncbi:hypothetical protein AUC68_06995 [Methyloceanibacter methanicus]|uniref:Uncharacterized protein n=1 Tax=Methyloceanibacter methanicus TaxID=1774968 RepID=A0A1E3VZF7_9HYPH|nr:hypothetical protein [Methyloceanibacter methanicus]ODR98912.1 hypothetical protein AUC68_06995 [Methyloceanibacter methanicus]
MKTVVTKAEYAAMKERRPSCVSNWIAEGKITSAALVGQGTRAKIWVEQADRDLAAGLHIGQQLAQDRPAFDRASDALPREETGSRAAPVSATAAGDDFLLSARKAKAAKDISEAKLAQLKMERETGRWIDAQKAQQVWSRELSGILLDIDTFITGALAREIADRHGLDAKSLAVEIRALYRAHRRSAADQAKEKAAAHTREAESAV